MYHGTMITVETHETVNAKDKSRRGKEGHKGDGFISDNKIVAHREDETSKATISGQMRCTSHS